MTALPKHKMTVDEFLLWSEAQPKQAGRFELWDGEIIEKQGAAGTINAQPSQHWDMKIKHYRAIFDAMASLGSRGTSSLTARQDQCRAGGWPVALAMAASQFGTAKAVKSSTS